MEKKKKDYDYIQELKEWQDHQYDPGYYLGGRIPPYIKNPGKRNYLGIALLIPVIMTAVIFVITSFFGGIKFGGFTDNLWPNGFIAFFTTGIISLAMIAAGVGLLLKPGKAARPVKKKAKKRRK